MRMLILSESAAADESIYDSDSVGKDLSSHSRKGVCLERPSAVKALSLLPYFIQETRSMRNLLTKIFRNGLSHVGQRLANT
jgi:hypothetical protein